MECILARDYHLCNLFFGINDTQIVVVVFQQHWGGIKCIVCDRFLIKTYCKLLMFSFLALFEILEIYLCTGYV